MFVNLYFSGIVTTHINKSCVIVDRCRIETKVILDYHFTTEHFRPRFTPYITQVHFPLASPFKTPPEQPIDMLFAPIRLLRMAIALTIKTVSVKIHNISLRIRILVKQCIEAIVEIIVSVRKNQPPTGSNLNAFIASRPRPPFVVS